MDKNQIDFHIDSIIEFIHSIKTISDIMIDRCVLKWENI